MRSSDTSSATSRSSGTSPTRATSGPKHTFDVTAATAPSTGKADRRGALPGAQGPQVVEDEDAVESEGLDAPGGVEGQGVVAKRRQRDTHPHAPASFRPDRRAGAQGSPGRPRPPSRATSAAPMAPARSPRAAGTMVTAGR